MGRIFVVELEGTAYKCKFCKTHLALTEDLVSRSFHCRRGKAYLFNNAAVLLLVEIEMHMNVWFRVNVIVGAAEDRLMLSGMHTVADIFCCCCGQIVGWKYEAAHDKTQKYKEGKFVLERGRILEYEESANDGVDVEFYIDSRPISDAEDL